MATTNSTSAVIKHRVPKVLSHQQVGAIFAEMTNLESIEVARRYVIHHTLHKAGLRAAELLNLRPEDIALNEEHPYLRVTCGKGSKQRNVPISTALEGHLRDWMAMRPESEWFFCRVRAGASGGKMDPRELRYMTTRAGEAAGVDSVNPHRWRHTCATELIEGGCATIHVARFLGHVNVATTECYLWVRQEELWGRVQAAQAVN